MGLMVEDVASLAVMVEDVASLAVMVVGGLIESLKNVFRFKTLKKLKYVFFGI